ncbi:MAG: LysE family transporter [Candidatus Promineifilaceae bacterium]|nr:LysE family transporter [Candidatus Promineifilaceae bacterium]
MLPLLGTFFVISLSGALSPGPLTTMAIVEGSRRGRWSGWWLALGHGLVEATYVALIALVLWFGRDALLRQPIVAGLIAVVGGAFLVWMGWTMGRDAWQGRLRLDAQAAERARLGLVPTGALVSLSNPYWWIWWALITPLYIQQSFAWGIIGVAVLYLVHWSSDLGWLTGLSWLTGSGRDLIGPRLYRWVMIVCGVALLFFGLSFIVAGINFLVTGQVSLS